ncbi:hypothetical protein L1D26_02475 [Vibrio mediterranei]|uniref:Uncharacterized protein n=1 Tax=Vibrio mediterranei TaxID=689 RepID=A0ABX5D9G6_9VIBR|nr:hypothetical protein [Vibrio mediterranei]MCG9661914.1 hypothetical protein [Vibrio mediterranei]PCD86319.1 hypothetical protein COR52_21910 [Vibrio mediterranei]PRQ66120.1 hypothetical protein COR51_18570 [Vibrio mediterranei]
MSFLVERHTETITASLQEFGFTEVQRGSDDSNFFIIGKLKYVNICISCNLISKSYECDILANKGYHNLVSDIPTMVFSIDAPLEVNVLGAIRVAHIQERALSKYVQTRAKFSAINQLKRLKEQNQIG